MNIQFKIDVNVRLQGMEELIAVIAADRVSEYDIHLLDTLAAKSERVTRKLERLDRETPPQK